MWAGTNKRVGTPMGSVELFFSFFFENHYSYSSVELDGRAMNRFLLVKPKNHELRTSQAELVLGLFAARLKFMCWWIVCLRSGL